jgi:two-component system LytT family sensor kinase
VVDSKLILITLLIKMGVAAAVSSSLSRSNVFKRLLLETQRTRTQTFWLTVLICVPLTLGVLVRVIVPNFLAADLSFETVVLLGILFGPFSAILGGTALAVPAVLHHEYFSLPINLAVALIFSAYGVFVGREEIWGFTPLIDLSLYRWIRRNLTQLRFDRQVLLLVMIMAMQWLLGWINHIHPRRLFALYSDNWLVELAVAACAPLVVGIPLKIWDLVRIGRRLDEQERLLLVARLDALQRQINPHFLFNTLNSISSLVRVNPEMAREMVVKLANILRTLLNDREDFVAFREELSFTDDYLDIEVVRFGAEKLKVIKEIHPDTLDAVVPSMLLQPLIENSIKHGLEPRIHGGTITIRSRMSDGNLIIEVEDDGVGVPPERDLREPVSGLVRPGTGIGMRNVQERMAVMFGSTARMEMTSRPGRGTQVTLVMPVLESVDDLMAAAQRMPRAFTRS